MYPQVPKKKMRPETPCRICSLHHAISLNKDPETLILGLTVRVAGWPMEARGRQQVACVIHTPPANTIPTQGGHDSQPLPEVDTSNRRRLRGTKGSWKVTDGGHKVNNAARR